MKIGFTGTQRGMTPSQIAFITESLTDLESVSSAHHGDCVGADAEFHSICRSLGFDITLHPLKVDSKRAFCEGATATKAPRDYLDRNHDIVDACDQIFCAPSGMTEKVRSGTWATVRYARKKAKSIIIAWPDGTVTTE